MNPAATLAETLAGLPVPGASVAGFQVPGWLLLIPLLAAALVVAQLRRRPPALAWPAAAEAGAAGARPGDPAAWAALLLRFAAGSALLLALAEPVGPPREVRLRHDGLDLLLVVDASGSMRALDADGADGARTRLELAREVVARFAGHRVAAGDRAGLVVFGASAFTQCPLTRDGALLAAALDRVEAGMAGEATALGDALALAVKRLLAGSGAAATQPPGGSAPPAPSESAGTAGASEPAARAERAEAPGASRAAQAQEPAAGRVIVLLTDGRANAGAVPTQVASALAAHHGIRVHAVGIGTAGEEVAMARPGSGRTLQRERHDLDAATLEAIAEATGGRAFRARRSADLEAVYAEIDRLERVAREAPPRVAGASAAPPFLVAAGLLLAAEILLARVLARRLP